MPFSVKAILSFSINLRFKLSLLFFFNFSCDSNCNDPANPSIRIRLTTTCTGHACDNANYQWQLVTVDSDGNEVSESLTRDMTQTELNLPGIIIKADQLPVGFTYRLKATVTPEIGPEGNAAYQFRMNAPPHSGQCTVSPGSGKALTTQFAFNCTGWQVSEDQTNKQYWMVY